MKPLCFRPAFRGAFDVRAVCLLCASIVAAASNCADAKVARIEILERKPYAEGREFDGVGAYQRLLGRVHFTVDPAHAANRRVVDLNLAPTNKQAVVEFSADLEILAPVDPARCNGALLYDVNNRGRRMMLRMFNDGADEFLMRRGYVVVWCGWLAEVLPLEDENLPGEMLMRMDAPVARAQSGPLTGLVRAEVVADQPATRWSLSNRTTIGSYRPAQQGLAKATLTRRLRESDPRVAIPRDQWRLEVTELPSPSGGHCPPLVELVMPSGIRAGYIHELIYEAQDPIVQGLGLTAIRDLVSFLKYDHSDENPLRAAGKSVIERAHGFGISQSGRCLRVLTYEGFNADEQGRQVFDGIIPHVSGGGLGFFNHRFAQPTRYASQHVDHLFPCDQFPFAYDRQRDPLSKREDGLLVEARKAGVVPKIMHIQNSAEYWHRDGSLVHTDPLGRRDAAIPEQVRIYAVGGAQHGWGDDAPRPLAGGQQPENPTDYRPLLRALLVALDAWVRDDAEPPPSRYPRLDDGTLVEFERDSSAWRPLPGVLYPQVMQRAELLDFGPQFAKAGRITEHPPRPLGAYHPLVAAHDATNNERGMLQLPTIAVPVATYTGWNLRRREWGAETELLSLKGSYIPLARTRQERRQAGDPRPSLAELYDDFDDYRSQYETAAHRLVRQRYLLEEDVPRLLERADSRRALFAE
ncbi:MAG: alpha/beta hydrolase domain-containing protein [Pirellulaceae bacterium]